MRALRSHAPTFLVAVALVGYSQPALCDLQPAFGGMHVAYALGAGVRDHGSGFRHGLDFSFMPLYYREHGPSTYLENYQGYLFGVSGMLGFGGTPSFLGLEVDSAASTIIAYSVGGGPLYRFRTADVPRGFGVMGRVTFDVLLVQAGLRLALMTGDGQSEAIATVSLGLGRF